MVLLLLESGIYSTTPITNAHNSHYISALIAAPVILASSLSTSISSFPIHQQSPKIPQVLSQQETFTSNQNTNSNLVTTNMPNSTKLISNESSYHAGVILLNFDQQVIYTLGVQPLEPLSDENLSKRWQQDSLWESSEVTPSRRSSDSSMQSKYHARKGMETA